MCSCNSKIKLSSNINPKSKSLQGPDRKMLRTLVLLLVGVAVVGANSMETQLEQDGRFGKFLELVRGGNLTGMLGGGNRAVALLAPTDTAFLSLPSTTLWQLKADPSLLTLTLLTLLTSSSLLDESLLMRSGEILRLTHGSSGQILVRQRRGAVALGDLNSETQNLVAIERFVLPASLDVQTMDNYIANDRNLSVFYGFLKQTNLLDLLKIEPTGPLTVLAPVNDAFASVSPYILRQLRQEPRLLRALVMSHILRVEVVLGGVAVYGNLLGELVPFRMVNGRPHANQAPLLGPPRASGPLGRLYHLGALLLPSIGALGGTVLPPVLNMRDSLHEQGLTIYSDLLDKATMTIDDATVFAPSNAALSSLPSEEVQRLVSDLEHLRSFLGSTIAPNPSPHFSPDLILTSLTNSSLRINVYTRASGDTVTTVNGVPLFPPTSTTGGILHATSASPTPAPTPLLTLLREDPRLSTFLAAAQAADLVHVLAGDGPLTVFAPTNDAFASLPRSPLFSGLLDLRSLGATVGGLLVLGGPVAPAQPQPGLAVAQSQPGLAPAQPPAQTMFSAGLSWNTLTTVSGEKIGAQQRWNGSLVLFRPGSGTGAGPRVGDGAGVVSWFGGGAVVDGAALVGAEQPATNGVLHVVDRLF